MSPGGRAQRSSACSPSVAAPRATDLPGRPQPHRNPVTPSAAFDVVVVGAGLGGLSVALRLADAGLSVGVMR
ncbi:MAG: FAD-binding protein, partial [Gammaproteobacteria bacterium]|nr:FAD-binding protein [Gammaproteobacteria bacterium]